MCKYTLEVFNDVGTDWSIECHDLKKMLQGEILDYTDCDDIHCLINVDIDDIIANLKIVGEYKIYGCELTPKILIYRN